MYQQIRDIILINHTIMKPQLGKYYYAPLRNYYAVWQWTSVSERGAMGSKVKEFFDMKEAREYVWKMNGWGTPRTALKRN